MGGVVSVKNNSGFEIELREWLDFNAPGNYTGKIRIPAFGSREIPAARYYDRAQAAGRPSIIYFYVDGKKASPCLIPQDFLYFPKLNLYVDGEGDLTVKGVEPRRNDFARLW